MACDATLGALHDSHVGPMRHVRRPFWRRAKGKHYGAGPKSHVYCMRKACGARLHLTSCRNGRFRLGTYRFQRLSIAFSCDRKNISAKILKFSY